MRSRVRRGTEDQLLSSSILSWVKMSREITTSTHRTFGSIPATTILGSTGHHGHSGHQGQHHSFVKCQSSMRNHQEGHNKRPQPQQAQPQLSPCTCPRPKVVNNTTSGRYTPAATPQNIAKRPITFSVRKNSKKGSFFNLEIFYSSFVAHF